MISKSTLITYKLLFALLGFSAIVTEIAVLVERGHFNPANFFSFFTIESNVLAVLSLLVSAFVIATGKSGKVTHMFRGAVALYMAITGIVFSVLLAGLDPTVLTAVPWDNIVLHYIMPVVIIVDWFVDAPKKRITFRKSLYWLIYPVLYVIYSLVRGAYVGWYPYPFLDPTTNGFSAVLGISVGIAGLSLALAWVLSRFAPGPRTRVKR
jgi:hypothetical protein